MGKSGVSKQGAMQGQKQQPAAETEDNKKSMGADYWDRIAEDAAQGYKNSGDDKILNEDQITGDNMKAGEDQTDKA